MRILATLFVLFFSFSTAGYAKTLTLATWNVDNLTAVAGKAMRSRAPKRTEEDFARLAQYAERLDADVIALQEVASPEAVARLFPPVSYTTLFSGRYDSDMRAPQDIFNALVLRKDSVRLLRQEDLQELAFGSYASGFWTRFGVAALLEVRGHRFWVLNVHLKTGCHNKGLKRPRVPACKTLAKQARVLGQWVAQKLREGTLFVLMGDFNRRINDYGARDHLWQALDPSGSALVRFPAAGEQLCPRHQGENFIDYIITDQQAAAYAVRGSFQEIIYQTTKPSQLRKLSDHCPLRLQLDIP